jgi:hypothetical protein
MRYRRENDRDPDALWYVVNHFLKDDPSDRPLPFAEDSGDLAEFAATGGLVLDTRDLFRLAQAIRSGSISEAVAQSLLIGTTGLFRYPAP